MKHNKATSPEAMADLKMLASDHGINAELIKSLTVSKEEARAHLSFFKRMIFFSNGIAIMVGLAFVGIAGLKLMDAFSIVAMICLLVGLFLIVKFTTVFVSMTGSMRKTLDIASKHDLI